MSPLVLFRRVAVLEAITWALLLIGMFLKYVTETTDRGVSIAGPVHGFAFVAYCVTAVVVAVDQRWSVSRLLLGLVAAVPPFATVVFDRYAERRGVLGHEWRLVHHEPAGPVDRVLAPLLRHPLVGLAVGAALVVAGFAAALVAGPPVGS